MAHQTSVSGIYCDDIRQEVGGKLSLIGIYASEMLFPELPAAVARICVHVNVKLPFGKLPKREFRVEVLKGEDVIGQMELSKDELRKQPKPHPDPDVPIEEQYMSMQMGFMLGPLQFDEPCRIRLHVTIDGKLFKGNGLKVRLPTDQERILNGWPLPAGATESQ